jgi:hypothetical protein
MRQGIGALAAIVLASFGLFIRFCSGPRPRVLEAHMHGNRAEVLVRNDSFGEGVVQVEARAIPRSGASPIVQMRGASLRPYEVIRVELPMEGARGDELLDVKIDYPPR